TEAQGGLLALPSNIGRYSRDRFAVLPEASINLGYQVTPWLRATAGYTFLYCSNVVRPGDQVNLAVNPTQLPSNLTAPAPSGPAHPGRRQRPVAGRALAHALLRLPPVGDPLAQAVNHPPAGGPAHPVLAGQPGDMDLALDEVGVLRVVPAGPGQGLSQALGLG